MRIEIALAMALLAGGSHAQVMKDLGPGRPPVTGTPPPLTFGKWCSLAGCMEDYYGPHEVVDVPPSHEIDIVCSGDKWCNQGNGFTSKGTNVYREKWTCADKSRFLMTSEDGIKHCIRLN